MGHDGRLWTRVSFALNNIEGSTSIPVEVEGPEGYYCQHLYLPELHRRPAHYVVYHDHGSSHS